jgi:phage baseplate assembly protein gpV
VSAELHFTHSRYTRSVSWRHRIALVVLTVLVALPAAGTTCAIVCASGAGTMTAHHGKNGPAHPSPSGDEGRVCTQPMSPAGPVISASQHDCATHDTAVRQLPTTVATRADLTIAAAPVVISALHVTLDAPRAHDPFADVALPDTIPLITTTVVLRV